jgi:uncharacterized membrane protein
MTGVGLFMSAFMMTFAWQTILGDKSLSLYFMSEPTWFSFFQMLGGKVTPMDGGELLFDLPLFPLMIIPFVIMSFVWGCFTWLILPDTPDLISAANKTGRQLLPWCMIPGVWFIVWISLILVQADMWATIVLMLAVQMKSLQMAGVLAVLLMSARLRFFPVAATAANQSAKTRWPYQLGLIISVYVLIYTVLNWGLWFNLRIPHGDSAMYEEHLWNVLHGKGFRSYLDQGLFLGEHIQFVHLFLLPLYYFWPQQLFMELVQSSIIACTAIPVYWIAYRHTKSREAALWLAAAVLLNYPLQFLDISIDLKTFRPSSFGIPALLLAIDAMERKKYGWMAGWMAITLSAQEDFSLVIPCIGLWLALTSLVESYHTASTATPIVPASRFQKLWQTGWKSRDFQVGCFWIIFGPVYLLAAMKAIHWFRGGVEIHYAGYFQKFGHSMREIIWTMLTQPGFLAQEFFTTTTLMYTLAMVLPLGFLPLLSPWRLLTGLPIFMTLCLNELMDGRARVPHYHFHAPLMPIIFWAAAAGLGQHLTLNPVALWSRRLKPITPTNETELLEGEASQHVHPRINQRVIARGIFALSCAFTTGLFFTLSPLGLPFWDVGSSWYWQKLYVKDKRAMMFDRIKDAIPMTARVASTDFVHPRYTHFDRSYDYSNYKRKQSGYEDRVPEDTDYIVIDTQHPYSTIKRPEELRELQHQPDQWKLLPDQTEGYYIILERTTPAEKTPVTSSIP